MRPNSQNKLRSARTPQTKSRLRTTQLSTQHSDLEDEEGAEAVVVEAEEFPESRAEETNNQEEPIPGLALPTIPMSTTWMVTEDLPIQMSSVVSMTTSRKTNPLATEPSNKRERKIPKKERSPRKIPTWKRRKPPQSPSRMERRLLRLRKTYTSASLDPNQLRTKKRLFVISMPRFRLSPNSWTGQR